MEPFPQTAVVLSPGKYRALLLTLKTWVSAVWLFSPTLALLIVSSRTAELVWVHKRQQVLPGCGDKTQASWVIQEAPPRVTWGLASGGGCPLGTECRNVSRCKAVGRGLDLQALDQSP